MSNLPKWVESAKYRDKIILLMAERREVIEKFVSNLLGKETIRKRVLEITIEIKELYLRGAI